MTTTPDTPAHMPLPLSCTHNSWERSTIYDAEGYEVCTIAISWEADEDTQEHFEALKDAKAAFIVRACNSHYQLVEALKAAIDAIEDDRGLDDYICCNGYMCGCSGSSKRQLMLHDLRAALSQAGGASE